MIIKKHKILKYCLCFILTAFYFTSLWAAPAALPTIDNMIASINRNLQPIMRLITGAGYVLGMYLLVVAILKLKQYGEARTMMSSSHF